MEFFRSISGFYSISSQLYICSLSGLYSSSSQLYIYSMLIQLRSENLTIETGTEFNDFELCLPFSSFQYFPILPPPLFRLYYVHDYRPSFIKFCPTKKKKYKHFSLALHASLLLEFLTIAWFST